MNLVGADGNLTQTYFYIIRFYHPIKEKIFGNISLLLLLSKWGWDGCSKSPQLPAKHKQIFYNSGTLLDSTGILFILCPTILRYLCSNLKLTIHHWFKLSWGRPWRRISVHCHWRWHFWSGKKSEQHSSELSSFVA